MKLYEKDMSLKDLKEYVGSNVCYISKYTQPNEYRLIVYPINGIRIGKESIMCYTRKFSPLSLGELTANTIMLMHTNIILVQEPFLDTNGLKERAERWCNNKGWLMQDEEWSD